MHCTIGSDFVGAEIFGCTRALGSKNLDAYLQTEGVVASKHTRKSAQIENNRFPYSGMSF